MKTQILLIVMGVVAVSLMSWTHTSKEPIDLAKWLLGTWENKTQRGSIFESWTQSDGVTMSGRSYKLNGQDTIVFESIKLVQEGGDLYYIPQVSDQNDGLPVRFSSTTITADEMIFENPEHDFPQVIAYKRVSSDSLVASISGMRNGEERKILFPMRKVH